MTPRLLALSTALAAICSLYIAAQPSVIKRPNDITYHELQHYERLEQNPRDQKALYALQALYANNDEPLLAYATGLYMTITFPEDELVTEANRPFATLLVAAPEFPLQENRLNDLIQKVSARLANRNDVHLKQWETIIRSYFARDVTQPELATQLGRIYLSWGRNSTAVGLFAYAFERDRDDQQNLLRFLDALNRTGNQRHALSVCREREETMRQYPRFFLLATHIAHDQGAYGDALRYARSWANLDPDNWQSWLAFGQAAYREGNYRDARTALARAFSINRTETTILRQMALLSAQEEDPQDCSNWLQKLRPLLDEEQFMNLLERPEFSKVPSVLMLLE